MYELMIERSGCHFRHIVFRDVAKSDIIFKLCKTEKNIFQARQLKKPFFLLTWHPTPPERKLGGNRFTCTIIIRTLGIGS